MSKASASVDWKSYMGTWYEQARFTSAFEPIGFHDVTAEYSILANAQGGKSVIRILNRGTDGLGFQHTATAIASVDPESPHDTLNVSFFPPFTAKYVVHFYDGNMSIVGSPTKNYVWLLTRNAKATPEQISLFLSKIKELGYNADGLVFANKK